MATGSGRQPLAGLFQATVCRTRAHVPRPTPSLFYYPGLTPSKPWHDPGDFAWVRALEEKREVVAEEYRRLRRSAANDYALEKNEHRLHQGQWEWHSFIKKGEKESSFAAKCPETAQLLESVPAMTDTPFSFAFFSTLSPNSAIAAHSAPCNIRLRCHFPLAVPTESDPKVCGMRVGRETRAWRLGKATIFDDSYDHEVWNFSSQERAVLLFDVWHPDLHKDEIEAIKDMFVYAKEQKWLT